MIGVVIVTFNRLEKLKESLLCFEKQTRYPAYILVVDNASTDGTGEFLSLWEKLPSVYERRVITTNSNLGGSGGFALALDNARMLKPDWIWISDDDAFPEVTAIEKAESHIDECSEDVVAICGTVLNHGEIDVGHRKRIYSKALHVVEEPVPREEYDSCFEINAFSYVGTIIKKDALIQAGTTKKDYFIWYDDTEHSLRLSKFGRIICFPDIRINHNIEEADIYHTWKAYYLIRNRMNMYKIHFSCFVYTYEFLKRFIKAMVSMVFPRVVFGSNEDFMKMYRKAIWDSVHGKLGMDTVYKPGWKTNSK